MDVVELYLLHTNQDRKYYLFMLCRSYLYIHRYKIYMSSITCAYLLTCEMSCMYVVQVLFVHVEILQIHIYVFQLQPLHTSQHIKCNVNMLCRLCIYNVHTDIRYTCIYMSYKFCVVVSSCCICLCKVYVYIYIDIVHTHVFELYIWTILCHTHTCIYK